MKLKSLVLAAFAGVAFSAHAATNLVTDGSFESQAVAYGTWGAYNSTAWNQGALEIRNAVAGVAEQGNNFAELDGTQNQQIWQSLHTVAGAVYDLSFWYAPRASVAADSNGIEALWNGEVIAFRTGTAPVWEQVSLKLVGTGSDTLAFRAVGTSDSFGGSLDNISVTAAVPEPETYAMLLAGLGLMGGIARRRTQK